MSGTPMHLHTALIVQQRTVSGAIAEGAVRRARAGDRGATTAPRSWFPRFAAHRDTPV
jgi:hypothetical protein